MSNFALRSLKCWIEHLAATGLDRLTFAFRWPAECLLWWRKHPDGRRNELRVAGVAHRLGQRSGCIDGSGHSHDSERAWVMGAPMARPKEWIFRQACPSFGGENERDAARWGTLSAWMMMDENAALYPHGRERTRYHSAQASRGPRAWRKPSRRASRWLTSWCRVFQAVLCEKIELSNYSELTILIFL